MNTKFFSILFSIVFLCVVSLSAPKNVQAQGSGSASCIACLGSNNQNQQKCKAACAAPSVPGGITNPAISPTLGGSPSEANSGKTFSTYFVTVWRALIVIGTLAMLFNLINGAMEWITAGGEQSKVQHARQKMTEGIVGLVILAGSFVLIMYIGQIFNFNLLNITFSTQ
jgi:hypothetical protein